MIPVPRTATRSAISRSLPECPTGVASGWGYSWMSWLMLPPGDCRLRVIARSTQPGSTAAIVPLVARDDSAIVHGSAITASFSGGRQDVGRPAGQPGRAQPTDTARSDRAACVIRLATAPGWDT